MIWLKIHVFGIYINFHSWFIYILLWIEFQLRSKITCGFNFSFFLFSFFSSRNENNADSCNPTYLRMNLKISYEKRISNKKLFMLVSVSLPNALSSDEISISSFHLRLFMCVQEWEHHFFNDFISIYRFLWNSKEKYLLASLIDDVWFCNNFFFLFFLILHLLWVFFSLIHAWNLISFLFYFFFFQTP